MNVRDEVDCSKKEEVNEEYSAKKFDGIIKGVVQELPNAESGLSNDHFKQFTSSKVVEKVSKKELLPEVSLKGIGSWEKHTKGIGLKLLTKFGFKGRLGLNEDGISRAIEVVVRPAAQGLGFGDCGEASRGAQQNNKKTEAEWRGTEFKDKDATERSLEQIASSKTWKKTSKQKTKLFRDADELLAQHRAASAPPRQIIIDMRQKEQRVLMSSGADGTFSSLSCAASESGPIGRGEELLHNAGLVADLLGAAVQKDSRRVAQELAGRLAASEASAAEVRTRGLSEAPSLTRLRGVHDALSQLKPLLAAWRMGRSAGSSLWDDVAAAGDCLCAALSHGPDEFRLFGLPDLLAACGEASLKVALTGQSLLQDPAMPESLLAAWQPLLARLESDPALRDHCAGLLQGSFSRSLFPAVLRTIANDWQSVERPAALLQLLGFCRQLVGPQPFRMLAAPVLAKLLAAVESWSPKPLLSGGCIDGPDLLFPHRWLMPWLPLLAADLSQCYPTIRRKLSRSLAALTSLKPAASDRLRDLLLPWVPIFDRESMDALLLGSVVPLLLSTLRELVINPAAQDLSAVRTLLDWRPLLPAEHLDALLDGELFPKWLSALSVWLSHEAVDLREVGVWYSGWKGLFEEELLSRDAVKNNFNCALNMMSLAMRRRQEQLPLHPAELLLLGAGGGSYHSVLERREQEARLRSRLQQLAEPQHSGRNSTGGAMDVSFREVVEAFAIKNGISFGPKLDGRRVTDEGHQLWIFGKQLCFFQQNVLFACSASGRPAAVSLDELLAVA